jgi:methylglyoxal synthase
MMALRNVFVIDGNYTTEGPVSRLGALHSKEINERPMRYVTRPMGLRKRIALIAHDNTKHDLLEWARFNKGLLAEHELYATGTTGRLLEEHLGLTVTCLQSGPLGGDQQIGARVAEGTLDCLIFFWDPLEPQPHDPDVKALLRIAVVWNIPVACNRASADFVISSSLMTEPYESLVLDYAEAQQLRMKERGLAETPSEG